MTFRRSFFLSVLAGLLLALKAPAQTVIYYDGTSSKPEYGLTALTNLGYTPTTVTNGGLASALTGKIDLVVIEEYNLSISSGDVTALANYISGGGSVVMSYWRFDSSTTLQAAFNVSHAGSFDNPQSVSVWVPGSAAMSGLPTTITALVDDNYWSDNGDLLTVQSGGTALAGYVASPTAGQAAIVAGNSNRTIVNAFIATDFSSTDMVKLFENEIKFVSVPEPSTWALVAFGGGGLWLAARRRRAS